MLCSIALPSAWADSCLLVHYADALERLSFVFRGSLRPRAHGSTPQAVFATGGGRRGCAPITPCKCRVRVGTPTNTFGKPKLGFSPGGVAFGRTTAAFGCCPLAGAGGGPPRYPNFLSGPLGWGPGPQKKHKGANPQKAQKHRKIENAQK